jgi:hypothetical protein
VIKEENIPGQFRQAIKEAFNRLYPSLELNFMEDQNWVRSEKPEPPFLVDAGVQRSALNFLLQDIQISDKMTVEDFRLKMSNTLNEEINVSRRYRNSWLKISLTSGWTLRQQNESASDL